MTALFAPIGRIARERRGLVIEAELPGADRAAAAALERAVGASVTEMGRDGTAGRLLAVAVAGGKVMLRALLTGARSAALAAERVYKGLECRISLLGDEVVEIALVDRPLGKHSLAEPLVIAVLYKKGEEMSITRAMHKYYETRPVSAAEIDAAWAKMTDQERALLSIKATLARPASGGRDFLDWYANRAFKGSGNPRRPGGQF